jgi:LacI family transcriptional regulator
VDGVIFVGSRNHPDELAVGEVPCVVVGEVPERVSVWRVGVDNEGGGRLVGEHLWALGHRRVGMVFSEVNPLPSTKRLGGAAAGLAGARRKVPRRMGAAAEQRFGK